MSETPEGIGGRKWSLLRHTKIGGLTFVTLQEGITELASLTEDGERVKSLLVTAPQLWDTANNLLQAYAQSLPDPTEQARAWEALANMVAKAVGKTAWEQVIQNG